MVKREAWWLGVIAPVLLALGAGTADAATIQDLVRLKGHEANTIIGIGLVIGLNGTGDTSKDSFIAARPYAELLRNLGNPVSDLTELEKADAYALVQVTMTIPPSGAREGDEYDVYVDKIFNAESLAGGRLVPSLLRIPAPDAPGLRPLAIAEGQIIIEGNDPASGRIRGGGRMLVDHRVDPVLPDGSLTLVLHPQYAVYSVADMIASTIEDEFAIDGLSNIAVVEDTKNIRVYLPEADRARPAQFIGALLRIPIDPSLIRAGARVVINEKAGIITMTGDVQLGPVAITHRGMQVTSLAAPAVDPLTGAPIEPVTPRRWVGLDTTEGSMRSTTRLADLLTALDQLNVSTEDQIAIIYELESTGALYAEVIP